VTCCARLCDRDPESTITLGQQFGWGASTPLAAGVASDKSTKLAESGLAATLYLWVCMCDLYSVRIIRTIRDHSPYSQLHMRSHTARLLTAVLLNQTTKKETTVVPSRPVLSCSDGLSGTCQHKVWRLHTRRAQVLLSWPLPQSCTGSMEN